MSIFGLTRRPLIVVWFQAEQQIEQELGDKPML